MREHVGLFRGKRIDNGEWVEGCLLKVTLNGKTAHLIFGDNFSFVGGDVKALSHALVAPDTVGECTGVTDKNGKLIFEHQTIKYERNLYKVRMWCGMWCMFDKWEHYCELYKYAGSSEIASEKGGEG